MLAATASPCTWICSIARPVSCTACRPLALASVVACADTITSWARREIWAPEWAISSTVAAVSCTAASCCSTPAACCCAWARISATDTFRFSVASRLCTAISRRFSTMRLSVPPSLPISCRASSARTDRSPAPTRSIIAENVSSGPDTVRRISTVRTVAAATAISSATRIDIQPWR